MEQFGHLMSIVIRVAWALSAIASDGFVVSIVRGGGGGGVGVDYNSRQQSAEASIASSLRWTRCTRYF